MIAEQNFITMADCLVRGCQVKTASLPKAHTDGTTALLSHPDHQPASFGQQHNQCRGFIDLFILRIETLDKKF